MEKQSIDSEIYKRLKEISEMKWQATDKLKELLQTLKPKTQRSNLQNNSLHKYFSLVSEAMCDAGYTIQEILQYVPELQPSPSFVKRVWQQIQKSVLGKSRTRDLEKHLDIDKVYDEFNLFLAEKLKIENIPFPHDPNKKKEMEMEASIPEAYQGEYPTEESEGIDIPKQVF